MLVQCTCAQCGTAFARRSYQFKRSQVLVFCAPECRWRYYSDQKLREAWASVNRNGPMPLFWPNFGACWIWTASLNASGYGHFSKKFAHQMALTEKIGGPIPDDFDVCHACDTPACVRNDEPGIYVIRGIARPRFGHLWLGTPADNSADKLMKGRQPRGDDSWARQHPELLARGERHGGARLTESQVREIRQRYAAGGITQVALGREYGVAQMTISGIVTGREWQHVL